MQLAEMKHIPLGQAFLCVDCASVGNSSAWCPACSSTSIQSLAQVLDRQSGDGARKDVSSVHPND